MKVKKLVTLLYYCGTEYRNLAKCFSVLFQSLAIENTKNHYFFTFHILINSPEKEAMETTCSDTIETLVCYP
jgi:hypothetical protein